MDPRERIPAASPANLALRSVSRVARVVRSTALRAMLAAGLVVFISSCGLSIYRDLPAPDGVEATTDLTDRIEVTWNEVDGADVYYVYRSLSPAGPFETVPHRTVRQTVLLDVEIDPTSYYYAVSAGRLSTGYESELSSVVQGTRVAPEIGWQDASVVFGAPGTVRLTLDRTTPTVTAYLLTVGDSTGATASVRRIGSDGAFDTLGAPQEPTDGTDTRVADIAAAGTLYAALVAEDPEDEARTDEVFLFAYDEELEEWEWLEGLVFEKAHPSAPFVTLAAIGADDLLITYRNASGGISAYRYTGTLSSLTAPAAADDSVSLGDPSVGQIDAAATPGGAALLFEMESDDPATLGDTISLSVSVWDGSDWPSGSVVHTGAVGESTLTGAAGIAIDPTVTPVSAAVTVGFITPTGVVFTDAAGTPVPGADTGFPGVPDLETGTLAVAAQEGLIYVFYVDLAQDHGVVAYYDTTGSSWTTFSPTDFTQSTVPSKLTLGAGGGKLFSAFDDAGITRMRAYQ